MALLTNEFSATGPLESHALQDALSAECCGKAET